MFQIIKMTYKQKLWLWYTGRWRLHWSCLSGLNQVSSHTSDRTKSEPPCRLLWELRPSAWWSLQTVRRWFRRSVTFSRFKDAAVRLFPEQAVSLRLDVTSPRFLMILHQEQVKKSQDDHGRIERQEASEHRRDAWSHLVSLQVKLDSNMQLQVTETWYQSVFALMHATEKSRVPSFTDDSIVQIIYRLKRSCCPDKLKLLWDD